MNTMHLGTSASPPAAAVGVQASAQAQASPGSASWRASEVAAEHASRRQQQQPQPLPPQQNHQQQVPQASDAAAPATPRRAASKLRDEGTEAGAALSPAKVRKAEGSAPWRSREAERGPDPLQGACPWARSKERDMAKARKVMMDRSREMRDLQRRHHRRRRPPRGPQRPRHQEEEERRRRQAVLPHRRRPDLKAGHRHASRGPNSPRTRLRQPLEGRGSKGPTTPLAGPWLSAHFALAPGRPWQGKKSWQQLTGWD